MRPVGQVQVCSVFSCLNVILKSNQITTQIIHDSNRYVSILAIMHNAKKITVFTKWIMYKANLLSAPLQMAV